MSNEQIVKPGQVWADNDKRMVGRTLRVDAITSSVFTTGDGLEADVPYAVCTVLTNRDGHRGKPGRQVAIRLARFRPTANGYRLVSEAKS